MLRLLPLFWITETITFGNMKHRLVFFFMFLLTIGSYAGGIPDGDFKKFQIGINASPDITYIIYGREGAAPTNMLKDAKAPKFGFTGGFNACYNLNGRIGFEAGLQYSNKGYQLIKLPLNASGNKPTAPISVSTLYNLHYIDIPIKANFTMGDRKVQFFGSAGLVTNVLIQERWTRWLEYKDRTEMEKYILPKSHYSKRVFFSAMVSAGISWQINEKLTLRIEPTYRIRIPPLFAGPGNTYLVNAGLNFGLYVGL